MRWGPSVHSKAVRDPAATVVAADTKVRNAQRIHYRHHVVGKAALAVVAVVGQPRRLGRIAITAQVGHHQKKVPL